MRVIYKFTIKTSNRFYVGQYSGDNFKNYWGSGHMWLRFLKGIQRKYPTCWKRLVKREILWQGECNQKTLDKLEEVYIRREHAHYSEGLGGCNILWGTANEFGSGSPMKDPDVARRVTEKIRGRRGAKRSEEGKKNISIGEKRSWINADSRRKLISDRMNAYMANGGKENLQRKMTGRVFSEEHKRKIKESHADFSGKNHPCYGMRYKWINNGIINKWLLDGNPLPSGFSFCKIK